MVEITATEQNIEKRMKRNKDSLQDLWDNICNIGVPEGEEREKCPKKIFEEIIPENFLNMGKEIVNQVQEAHRVLCRINPRRNTPRHIVIKLTKRQKQTTTTKKKKRQNIKSNKGKMTNNIQGNVHQAIS